MFLFFVSAVLTTVFAAHGIVEIDQYSFGKVVGTGHMGVLIAFIEYSWKSPEFYEQVGDAFQGDASILVAKLDVSDVPDDKPELSPSTPTLRFYPANGDPFAVYTGDVEDSDAIIAFVRAQVSPQMQQLSVLAKTFASASADQQESMEEKATALVDVLDAAYARTGRLYLAMMKRIRDRGAAFVTTEQARLINLIGAESSVSEDKMRDFKERLSILRNFDNTWGTKTEL